MDRIWFVHSNNETKGPLTTSEVKDSLAENKSSVIWCRSLPHWITSIQWTERHSEILSGLSPETGERSWYYLKGRDVAGPMYLYSLLDELKKLPTLARIRAWTFGMGEWRSLFEIPQVIQGLGLDQRKFARVLTTGMVTITKFDQDHIRPISTLGEGGVGVRNAVFLIRGEKVRLSIQCEDLDHTIHTLAEVRYVDTQGNAGFQFINLESKDQASIRQMIKNIISTDQERLAA